MAKRLFTKVSPEIWTSRRFRGVESSTRCAFLYLLTNAHIDSTGCYRLPVAYGCSDFGIDEPAFLSCLKQLILADMISHDADAEYVLIKRWFRHNPLTNLDHAEGTRRLISLIESDALRQECEAAFDDAENELKTRLEKNEAARAERAAKAKLRIAQAHNGNEFPYRPNASLADTKFMKGAAR